MTTSHRSTLNRWPLTCFMTGRDQVWNLDGSFKTIVEQQQQQGRSCMCFFCSLFFSILSPWLFFVEVILAVRVIWIDVSTFECIFESICRAGHSIYLVHHTSKVRVLGSLGFRKLVFKIYYYIPRRLAMMVGMGLDSTLVLALQKEGSFWPVLHFILFSKRNGWWPFSPAIC